MDFVVRWMWSEKRILIFLWRFWLRVSQKLLTLQVSGQRQREKHLLHEDFNGGALPATLQNSEQKRFTHNTQRMLRDFRSASQKYNHICL